MDNKKVRLGLLLGIIAIGIAGGFAHYSYQIHQAKEYIQATLLPQVRAKSYPLALADLSPWQQEALLKVEDPSFYQHHGVDYHTPGEGISTITQTLAQLLFFQNFSAGIDKLRQSLLARYALDPLVSKQEQLLLYINMVPMGQGGQGLASAAQVFFSKPFKELSQDEYLALVGAIVDPASFDPRHYPERCQQRVERIKLLMAGKYQPKGVFDVFYGKLDVETRKHLPPYSYFASYYD